MESKCPGNCKKSYGITSKPDKIYEKYSRRISFLAMLCMLLEQLSSTVTPCHMDCSKKLYQVNLLAIVNVYVGLLLFITVLKNGKTSVLMTMSSFCLWISYRSKW